MTTTVSSLVAPNGNLTKHPLAGMFRTFLRSRKPGALERIRICWDGEVKTLRRLAAYWLNEGEGLLLALQYDLAAAKGVPQFIDPKHLHPHSEPLVDFDDLVAHWEDETNPNPDREDDSHAA
jgi:hypothetical protein